MKFEVNLDFRPAMKAAEEAALKTKDAYSAALKAGLGTGFTGPIFRDQLNQIQKHQNDIIRLQTTLQRRESLRQKKEYGGFAEYQQELMIKTFDLQRKLGAAASDRAKADIESQIKEMGKLLDETTKIDKAFGDFTAESAELAKNLAETSKSADSFARRLSVASKTAEAMAEIDMAEIGSDLGGAIGSGFTDSVDVSSMARSLGEGTSKWMTKGLKGLKSLGVGSGGGAKGAAGKGLLAVGGALTGLVAGLGALIAAFIGFDKKMKEFNKSAVKTYGALSIVRLGAGNLREGLNILRRTTNDLAGNLGVTQEEANALFDSLDKGGITLDRITGGTANAALATDRLQTSLRRIYAVANVTGVGLSEYTDNLTNYVNDLAMSADTVNESFAQIAKMAEQSAFGTRRFYSMVTQATAGQSSLNVRLEQTGDLLMRMSKIMGQKRAAELVGGAATDLAGMGASERIKTLMVAGRQGGRVFQREAGQQAANFARGTNTAQANAFTTALESVGLTGRGLENAVKVGSDSGAVIDALAGLSPEDQRKLLTEVRASGNEEMARRLESITNLSRAARGGLGQRTGAIGEISAGGSLAMRAAQLQTFLHGRTAGELGATDRVAAENLSGMSGQAMDAFLQQIRAQQGAFEAMRRGGRATGTSPADIAARKTLEILRKQYHVTVDQQGRIYDEMNNELSDGNDLFQATVEPERQSMATAEDIARETMDATVSMADILENNIANMLQRVYEVLEGPLNDALEWIMDKMGITSGPTRLERSRARETTRYIEEKLVQIAGGKRAREREIKTLRGTSGGTPEEQAKRAARITELQGQISAGENETGLLTQTREELRQGHMGALGGFTFTTEDGVKHRFGNREDAEAFRKKHKRTERFTNRFGTTRDRDITPEIEATGPLTNEAAMDYRRRERDTAIEAWNAAHPGGAAPGAGAAPGTAAVVPGAPVVAPAGGAGAAPAAFTAEASRIAAEQVARVAAVAGPAGGAVAEQTESTEVIARRERTLAIKNNKILEVNLKKIASGRSLGDGMAESKLPNAIALADAKMRLMEKILGSGKTAQDVNQLLGGTANEALMGSLTAEGGQGLARAIHHSVSDFVYQDRGGGRSVITPIDREDQVVGMRPGGAIAGAGGRAGGNVNIVINGGDERRVFEVVRRAIQQAGITPNRVPGGAT